MATAAEAANHIFLSISRFRDLVSAGTITRKPSNAYTLDEVREQYCKNAQLVMAGRSAEGGKALSTARARLAEAQAQKAEMANAIALGEFIETQLMRRILEGLFATIRENILGLAGKIADNVAQHAPEQNRAAVYAIINGECRELLAGLAAQDTMERAVSAKMSNAEVDESPAC